MTVHASVAKYTRIRVTAQPEVEAQEAYNALYTQDDAVINAQARVFQAKVKGQVVWALKLTADAKPSLFVTQQQAASLGLCHCGRAAEYVGFEGLRCGQHAKLGMSTLCTQPGCTNVSHTGFSWACNTCMTPAQKEAYEANQARLRAEAKARESWGYRY